MAGDAVKPLRTDLLLYLAACFTLRWSAQMMELRSGFPCLSTGRQPIICPLKLTTFTSLGCTWLLASSACVESQTAFHQSWGSCSAFTSG